MDKKNHWKYITWVIIVLWVIAVISMGIAITVNAQVTPGTVFSKTEDGVGNKITSTVVGPARGLDVNIVAGGGGGPTYLDADGIVNQTASAVHGQTYMYNGATWDRARGTIANGMLVDVSRITGNVTVVQPTGTSLHIVCDGGTCGGAASFADSSPFTFGASGITNIGAVVDDVATNVVAENSAGNPRMHPNRILYEMSTNSSGVALYPTATVEADAIANPTLTQISTFIHGYNGVTWDRLRSSIANGLVVDVSRVQGNVTVTGTVGVTQSTSPWVVSGTVGVSNAFLLDSTFTGRWTAASLDADAIANETTTSVHGKCYLYNGASWDRCRGSVANGLTVSVSNATLAVTQSGTWNIGTLTSITNAVAVTNAGLTNLDVALSTRLADSTFTGRFVAATLDADAIANQTTTSIHGMCYMYNGASWDRCRGAAATGLLVNVSNASFAVTGSLGRTWTLSSGTDSVAATVSNAFLLDATFTGRINTLGQKTMANSTPVVLASDQSAIPVTILSTVSSANNSGACPSGAANFTVVSSNASRTWLAIWASPNNTDNVFIKLGVTAANTNAVLAPGQPVNFTTGRIYTGQIDALPNSGTQAVCLMELN